MQVVDRMMRSLDGLDLDVKSVGLKSVSESDIKLPYLGDLSGKMLAESASIYLNVQPTQRVRALLVVKGKSGEVIKRPLQVSSGEIVALLDKFFQQDQEDTGLSPYWLGLWQAHYIDWRKIVTGPDRLLEILYTLTKEDRASLIKHMNDDES